MGRQVVWYERGSNAVRQVIYTSVSDNVQLKQLNNILLIKDGERIAKCMFDVNEQRYNSAIIDFPALPEIEINITEGISEEGGRIDITLNVEPVVENGNGLDKSEHVSPDDDIFTASQPNKYVYDAKNYADQFSVANLSYRQEDTDRLRDAVMGKYKLLCRRKPKYYAGYVFISYAFELYDGSITKACPPRMVRLGKEFDRDLFWITHTDWSYDSFRTNKIKGYVNNIFEWHDNRNNFNGNLKNGIAVGKIDVGFSAVDFENLEEYKDIIKSVVVYASEPVDPYDWERADANYFHANYGQPYEYEPVSGFFVRNDLRPTKYWGGHHIGAKMTGHFNEIGRYNLVFDGNTNEGLVATVFNADKMSSVILYKVETFELGSRQLHRDLDLTAVQTKENMPIDASGWWDTSGEMFVYNQRLHLFNYVQTFKEDVAILGSWQHISVPYVLVSVSVEVYIKTDNSVLRVYFPSFLQLGLSTLFGTMYLEPPEFIA